MVEMAHEEGRRQRRAMVEPSFDDMNDAFNDALISLSRLRALRNNKLHWEGNKESQLRFAIDEFLRELKDKA